jgi:leucyl-tRNA synthetase
MEEGQQEELEIYTTRPDTLFGMSFCAISPAHPLVQKILNHAPCTMHQALSSFITECNRIGTTEAAIETAEKKGFDTGLKIKHPFEEREVPLYIANFVLMDYGTGAIFGCPAHDERDFEFAVKYGLPIIEVVSGESLVVSEQTQYSALSTQHPHGTLINSDFLNGMGIDEAKKSATAALEKLGVGTSKTNYRLRDWGISRQRYWGCPIPIIYCDNCGVVPVPESSLPVELPKDVTFDKPGNPLDRHPTWKHVNCPKCAKPALRETDTFDTFFESSWYFSRFATIPDANPLNPESLNYWLPVDCYIGGIEHAVLHLLYSRFFTRALGRVQDSAFSIQEPFKRLETQGMICHETYKHPESGKWLYPEEVCKRIDGTFAFFPGARDEMRAETRGEPGAFDILPGGLNVIVGRSEKMSKSKKNTVDPRSMMETYGADAARLFMLSDSPPERDLEWTDAGIEGAWRYLNRLWRIVQQVKDSGFGIQDSGSADTIKKATHKTIKAVTDDIDRFHFNKAIARIRELTNLLEKHVSPSPESRIPNPDALLEGVEVALHLLQPFLPHIAEECWAELGHKDMLINRPWPVADAAFLVDESVTVAIQINGKLKTTIELPKDLAKEFTEARVFELPAIKEALTDKQVKKVVVVPNRIVNIVVG